MKTEEIKLLSIAPSNYKSSTRFFSNSWPKTKPGQISITFKDYCESWTKTVVYTCSKKL